MCGINGIVNHGSIDLNYDIKKMNSKIFHRGPDEEGLFFEKKQSFSIGMGMRRLSIIDIANGSQPFYSSDGNVAIVFNGEIYNYNEIKNKLKKKSVVFKTNSDTEVILNLYLKYGLESFSELDGMYAFSIYDKNKKKIFIARDYFGEKPLYYYKNKNCFIWASELKSIMTQVKERPQISSEALELYFSLTYIPAPFTIYDGISKLEANKFLEYSLTDKKIKIHNIHEKIDYETFKGSFKEAKKITKNLVSKSVFSRSVSDVPIGSFLSGGVDSSIVSYCLAKNTDSKINTFSIGFKNKNFDETDKSRIVAKLINSNHHEFVIEEKNLFKNLSQILNNFDEPFADSSALPTYLVSKITSNHVKVALTGDGGDEVFGGYNKYYMNKINAIYTNLIPSKIHSLIKKYTLSILKLKDDNRGLKFKIKKAIDSVDYDNNFYWKIISLGFKEKELFEILINNSNNLFKYYKNELKFTKPYSLFDLRQIDKKLSLEGDMLVKVDRTSMLTSLECRAPFLNKELWDFTNSLPEKYLINKTSKKYILKESFKDVFPSDFLEKSKQGFGVPVGDWLRSFLKAELTSYINYNFLKKQNLFNYDNVKDLVEKHISGKEDNTFKVWTYFCFQKWYLNNYKY